MKRNIYLKTISLDQAREIIAAQTMLDPGVSEVPISEALGRVTKQAVFAQVSNPNHNAAAMDGIAVISERTHGASETRPVQLEHETDFVWVNTGHVIRKPYDAVIMVEDLEIKEDDSHVTIRSGAYAWQHVRMVGEDIAIGDMIVPSGRRIGPFELGAMAAAGVKYIRCVKPLRVGLIPTGSEIVSDVSDFKEGGILESNSLMFWGMVQEARAEAFIYPIVKDAAEDLKAMVLRAAAECDVVVINAGSSAGSEDYTRLVLEELGSLHFHGIDIKPGKPSLFATLGRVPVFGIPGYPVSAYIAFEQLVMPLLKGQGAVHPGLEATLTRPLVSSLKHEEFVRVQVGLVHDKVVATPLARGAGATMSLVKANGLARIPRSVEGYEAGQVVVVSPLNEAISIHEGLIAIGSHDLVMDVIDDLAIGWGVVSSHVGSLGGILALKRGEAHLAPIHLLNSEGGGYNTQVVSRYFPGENMVLIKRIKRLSGFYTRKDTLRPGIDDPKRFEKYMTMGQFINRQKGSGTRLLTDYMMGQAGVLAEDIQGYDLEVLTHTAVAQAIKVGSADVGIGIASVAQRMDLHFDAICHEDYDFLLRHDDLDHPLVKKFMACLESDAFERQMESLGGYVLEPMRLEYCGGGPGGGTGND